MSAQLKGCPKCKQPAPLQATTCAGCGHQFRTQFPPDDRTQMFTAPAAAASAAPAPPAYHATVVTGGPIDATERTVALAWTVIGLLLAAAMFASSGKVFTETLYRTQKDTESAAVGLLWFLAFGAILSALTMRLRRLYLASPDGYSASDIMGRRRRFAVIASLALVALFGITVAAAVEDYQKAALKMQETPAAAAAAPGTLEPAETLPPLPVPNATPERDLPLATPPFTPTDPNVTPPPSIDNWNPGEAIHGQSLPPTSPSARPNIIYRRDGVFRGF